MDTDCGRGFSTSEFDDYVGQLAFTAWHPQFVVVHNTGVPSLAQRPVGFTQTHIQNLVTYYRYAALERRSSLLYRQNGITGIQSADDAGCAGPSWNAMSWGVETLGDHTIGPLPAPMREHLVACLATLHAAILDVNNLRFHKKRIR